MCDNKKITQFIINDEGELLAYNEMMVDAKVMNEKEFVSKYLNILNKLAELFENEEFKDEKEIEKMSGYNNTGISSFFIKEPISK